MKPHVIIYTDGGASPNPGRGGWAAILYSPQHDAEREIYGCEDGVTNNQMELTAAIRALEALKIPCRVDLFTDSSYLNNAFTKKWISKWLRNGWKTSSGDEVSNRSLWERLLELAEIHEVAWHWVAGHSGCKLNERCDALVRKARNENKNKK